jgi:hypothetical protein
MMDEIEEEDRLRRANDLAIARMLWDDAAAIPREFVTSSGIAPIAQGSSRTAAALSALRGGDDLVDEAGGPATREPARTSTTNIGRIRLFISSSPLMVGPEDPVVDDGYGHPSMDDVGRIYDGNNPIQVTPTAPPVVQAPTPQTGPTTVPRPSHNPFPPIGQNFMAPQRPADQSLPPLIYSSSAVQAENPYSQWLQSQQRPISLPGILNISPPNENFLGFNGPLMVHPPIPASAQLERTYSQNASHPYPPHWPRNPNQETAQGPNALHPLGANYSPGSFPGDGRNTSAPSPPVRTPAEPSQPQLAQWLNSRNNFRPMTPRPSPLEQNPSIPDNNSANPMNPALDPYTIMVRNANQNATQNATHNVTQGGMETAMNDPFAQLFNDFNNPLSRTQQHTNTNTTTFSPTMWGTPLFPQPPLSSTPVQPSPTPTPLPPPIIIPPGSAPAQTPVQPPVQPPIQPPIQHSMQHPTQHQMQPHQPMQNPPTPLPPVPLPPPIIPETTNRTTPQTPQLTPLPPPPIIPAPTTIMPNPPPQPPSSQVPTSQRPPSHTTISYSDRQPHAMGKPIVTTGVEGGKLDLTVLVGWIPFLGIAGLVFYAFSNVGVLILAGVVVWYAYRVPAGRGEKK